MGNELSLPYVPIDPRIETHPKTRRFVRAMGAMENPMLHMHLMRFLVSVGEHYPDGNLGKLEDLEIGYMARWGGDAKKFTEALVSSGWLMFGAGGYVVVGWGDYGGQVYAKRVAFREKQSENRRKGWEKKNNQIEPVTTKPNQNIPNETKTSEGEGEGEGEVKQEQQKALTLVGKTDLTAFVGAIASAGIAVQLGSKDRERFSKLRDVQPWELEHAIAKAVEARANKPAYVLSVIEGERSAAAKVRDGPPSPGAPLGGGLSKKGQDIARAIAGSDPNMFIFK